ncbi:polysaccharide pyruvyl transferase family protein [Olsenella sp. Marseille-QA0557]|uniref:polysaccharide pyruvyl transferase family protein n=1 Tax=Olsenella sp. Marseille-QA0557 TaxID=3378782 RepID=UPI003D137DC7
MDNRLKMAIKSVPVISTLAKTANRTIVRSLKFTLAFPRLRENNRELLKCISQNASRDEHNIWYFGVPTHQNLGDQAQKFVILSWLARNYPTYRVIKIPSACFNGSVHRTISAIREAISPEDLIVMQSGHTMDGLHPDETAHRAIPDAFPDNRVVFFPTSIEFVSKRGMLKDASAINKHPRILFLARDPVSAGKARELYPDIDVRLYPDVVTSLIGRYCFRDPRGGLLFCTRNDGEKLYSYKEIDRLADKLSALGPLDRTDTTVDWRGVDLNSDEAWRRIEDVIASYSRYRVVVTDRYHGTIFARIAGTPVVVLRTTDHKVTSEAEWFTNAGDEAIAVAEGLEQVPSLTKGFMERYPDGAPAPAFAVSYYEGLKDVIEAM